MGDVNEAETQRQRVCCLARFSPRRRCWSSISGKAVPRLVLCCWKPPNVATVWSPA